MATDSIKFEGVVESVLKAGHFHVDLLYGDPPQTVRVMAKCSGRMRRFNIKLVKGDRVDVELSPYDLTKGRITRRHKV